MEGADILVFPEYGLTSTILEGGDVLSLAQVVPRPADSVVPCHLNHTDDHTQVAQSFGGTSAVVWDGYGVTGGAVCWLYIQTANHSDLSLN